MKIAITGLFWKIQVLYVNLILVTKNIYRQQMLIYHILDYQLFQEETGRRRGGNFSFDEQTKQKQFSGPREIFLSDN